MPLDSGATFAGYTILRLLGRGGMSEDPGLFITPPVPTAGSPH
jgi:hypothetical protein